MLISNDNCLENQLLLWSDITIRPMSVIIVLINNNDWKIDQHRPFLYPSAALTPNLICMTLVFIIEISLAVAVRCDGLAKTLYNGPIVVFMGKSNLIFNHFKHFTGLLQNHSPSASEWYGTRHHGLCVP